MPWYELTSADDPKLGELAKRYQLHPLHVEDARSPDEGIKVDQTAHYTFAVLKPVRLAPPPPGATGIGNISFSTIDIFAGNHNGEPFFITIADPDCPTTTEALERARREGEDNKPARLLYLILDTIVDLYFPAIDHYDERLDELENRALAEPHNGTLQSVFSLKRELIELRRILVGTRDATLHLQRDPESIIDAEHQPFVRDIYDHVVRLLDSVETQRDLLNNVLDIYLTAVANRTNEVMKVLTVLGTLVTPAIAISGIYGMNLKGLPFQDSPQGAIYAAGLIVATTAGLLLWLRSRNWL
jgi:magnesium transporter